MIWLKRIIQDDREMLVRRMLEIEREARYLKSLGASPIKLDILRTEHSLISRKLRLLEGSPNATAHRQSDVNISGIQTPPRCGERLLLLILSKEERVNIPGDLEEEYRGIAARHGARYAKLWYYKQVAASGWPMIRKAVAWGLLASLGTWIRRFI